MQYLYHKDAKQNQIIVEGELYKYLFKVRRKSLNDILKFRNLDDDILYHYEIELIDRRKSSLKLINSEKKIVKHNHSLHIGWCVVDPKTIEKTLNSINELGVEKITFIYCEYSQKSFKINLERLNNILINSSQQCGRSSLMKLEICNSLDQFKSKYPNCYFVDFSQNRIDTKNINDINCIVIGPEGGFCKDERSKFDDKKIIGFNASTILKSQTAVLGISSKILL
jgi:16S rRNA (uracil1498-N3)-methyltransferase